MALATPVEAHDDITCELDGGIDISALALASISSDKDLVDLSSVFFNAYDFKRIGNVEFGGNRYIVMYIVDTEVVVLIGITLPCVYLFPKPPTQADV